MRVLFPLGLIIGMVAGYGTVLALVADGDAAGGPSIVMGDGRAEWYSRATAALLYAVTCFGSVYVAWCAFKALPISGGEASPGRHEPDEQGSPEVPSV